MKRHIAVGLCFLLLTPVCPSTEATPAAELAAKGESALRSGRPEEAQPLLQRAIQLDPAQAKALAALGLLHFSAGAYLQAEDLLIKAIQAAPDSFFPRFLLGATLLQQQKNEEAIVHLEAAHAVRPDHLDAAKLLSIEYSRQARYGDAGRVLLPLVQAGLKDEEIYLLLIEAHHRSGYHSGTFEVAQTGVALLPQSGRLHSWLGHEFLGAGEFVEAERHLIEAVHYAPDYHAPYYLLGDLFLKQQKYAESEGRFRSALARKPDHAEARVGLARALVGLGKPREAIEELQEQANLVPDNFVIHVELARIYFRLDDRESAQRHASLGRQLKSQVDVEELGRMSPHPVLSDHKDGN